MLDDSRNDWWRFGPFEFDARHVVLWRAGQVVPIQKLPGRVLAHLIRADGDVVSRADLLETFWGGRRVGFDDRLNTCVAEIRRALGDSAHRPRYVETVRGRGYRFCGSARPCGRPRSRSVVVVRPIRRRAVAAGVAAMAVATTLVFQLRPASGERPFSEALVESGNERARASYVQGMSLLTTGRVTDLRSASTLLSRSIAYDPEFAAAHSALAIVSALLATEASEPSHLGRAREALSTASRLRPGARHVELASRAIAQAAPRSAPDHRPPIEPRDDLASRLVRTRELRRSGAWGRLERELEAWVAGAPAEARPWADLAAAVRRSGRLEEADFAYQVAIGLAPNRPELYLRRAAVRLELGDTPHGAIAIVRAAESHTGMSAEYLIPMDPLLAVQLGSHIDYRGADGDRFERPYDRGVFYLSRGLIESSVGDFRRASVAYRRAIVDLEPLTRAPRSWDGTPDYYAFLGLAYAGLGRKREARDIAEQILQRFGARSDRWVAGYMRRLATEILARVDESGGPVDLLGI